MYTAALALHSAMRWGILFWGLIAVVRSASAWREGRDWDYDDEMFSRSVIVALFAQGALGYLLLGEFSPVTRAGLSDPAAAAADPALRFFTFVHPAAMTAAFVALFVARRRTQDPTRGPARHRDWLVGLAVGFALMLAVIPWPGLAYGRPWVRWPGGGP